MPGYVLTNEAYLRKFIKATFAKDYQAFLVERVDASSVDRYTTTEDLDMFDTAFEGLSSDLGSITSTAPVIEIERVAMPGAMYFFLLGAYNRLLPSVDVADLKTTAMVNNIWKALAIYKAQYDEVKAQLITTITPDNTTLTGLPTFSGGKFYYDVLGNPLE